MSAPPQAGWTRGLLVRRSLSDPRKVTAYVTFAPTDHRLTDLVRMAGMRWTVEESFQTGKGEVGLDHFTERFWRSLTYEEIYLRDYRSPRDARQGIMRYSGFYNHERPHQALDYSTPAARYFVP